MARIRASEAAARLDETYPDNEQRDAPRAFDWAVDEADHYNRWVADRTRVPQGPCREDDPFFALCSFPDPYHPFAAPEPWDELYGPDEVSLPTRTRSTPSLR